MKFQRSTLLAFGFYSAIAAFGLPGCDDPAPTVDAATDIAAEVLEDAAITLDVVAETAADTAVDVADVSDASDVVPDTLDVADAESPEVTFPDIMLPDAPPLVYDCNALPQGPFKLTKMDGPIASEDLAFDAYGNLVGSNDNAIFKSPYNGGPQVWVPSLNFRAGMRMLPNGHLIVCDNNKGELVRVDEEGVKHTLVTGLSYPNGITVDLKGFIYFTEHDGNIVWRVHPFTGEKTVLTDAISSPNGVAFSPDYRTLYIGGFNGNPTVYSMSISATGIPGKLVPFATVGSGWHDGMATDACGNVYLADYSTTTIWRISPDGEDAKVIIDASGLQNAYLPNMQWGSGLGGWNPMALYLPDGWNKGVFEVVIGVPAKEVAHP